MLSILLSLSLTLPLLRWLTLLHALHLIIRSDRRSRCRRRTLYGSHQRLGHMRRLGSRGLRLLSDLGLLRWLTHGLALRPHHSTSSITFHPLHRCPIVHHDCVYHLSLLRGALLHQMMYLILRLHLSLLLECRRIPPLRKVSSHPDVSGGHHAHLIRFLHLALARDHDPILHRKRLTVSFQAWLIRICRLRNIPLLLWVARYTLNHSLLNLGENARHLSLRMKRLIRQGYRLTGRIHRCRSIWRWQGHVVNALLRQACQHSQRSKQLIGRINRLMTRTEVMSTAMPVVGR